MTDGIKVDEFEPQQIEALIKQSVPDTIRAQLNRLGYADYIWNDVDNQINHLERKTVHEILSKPGDIELQIQKELGKCNRLYLVVEGIAEPIPNGVQTYELTDNGRYFRPSRKYGSDYARYEGFLLGLSMAGVNVWKTSSWLTTAQYIVRLYYSTKKTIHNTLNRYISPSLPVFSPNPQVQALLGLCQGYDDLRIGPVVAIELIKVYSTIWNLIHADPNDVAGFVSGISVNRMSKLLEYLGKKV